MNTRLVEKSPKKINFDDRTVFLSRDPFTCSLGRYATELSSSVYGPKEFCLVLLTSRFEATRGQFWDRTRLFEPRSDDEDDA
ncbi:hypothetical protein AVEN_133191-1 [Araneus ventricosus]|uniref:Uncharacterized protein n=1 Tax=Araneus ventricosus TaxID=182803 RepID=A0A4Y2B867_ARAVE|nr:hypothetical protein AVEN_173730-1 [Araneus ventricosus]GBL88332.1 hypothetical protein AVEN_108656-1 [Araneus ventricosus]GBL91524.1 hypothetical protein AVEN_133191-1 [Araneus ventricosus]